MDLLKNDLPSTPAFVFDQSKIIKNLDNLVNLKKQSGCQVLYSIKALPLEFILILATKYLDGLSVSSLFEARLAKELLGNKGILSITTPGLRDDEFEEITELCTQISFNSMSQYQRLAKNSHSRNSLGLRLNPKLSFADDPRFDPCRPYSKLGIDSHSFNRLPDHIEGLHFHTVFSSTDYTPLITIVDQLEEKWAHCLDQLKWLNLGGGYLYSQIHNHQPFIDTVRQLKAQYNLDIYIEPGKTLVNDAGYLVSTVIDQFNSDGKTIIVLDSSVNHHPELFEYQRQPQLLEEQPQGNYSAILVGSSCLAGDIFGEYQFKNPPKLGDRFVFSSVGAYSLIKANRFNGYNLPDVYLIDGKNQLLQIQHSSYQNYRELWIKT